MALEAIHFYRTGARPLYLLTVFAKNDKDNLTPTEAQQMQAYGDRIARTYGRLS